MKVGLYLGATALCDLEETPPVSGDQVPRWNKKITFGAFVQDLPLSGRLCMGVVGVSKRKKKEVRNWERRGGDAVGGVLFRLRTQTSIEPG